MKDKIERLVRRVPWRLLTATLGAALVVNGGAHLVSAELPAESGVWTQAAKQGMGMVISGSVALIAAIILR